MNLGFMTKWANGEPTYFVEKIWAGLRNNEISTRSEELFYSENAKNFFIQVDLLQKYTQLGKTNP